MSNYGCTKIIKMKNLVWALRQVQLRLQRKSRWWILLVFQVLIEECSRLSPLDLAL